MAQLKRQPIKGDPSNTRMKTGSHDAVPTSRQTPGRPVKHSQKRQGK